jgi:hypothetical protein
MKPFDSAREEDDDHGVGAKMLFTTRSKLLVETKITKQKSKEHNLSKKCKYQFLA